MATTCNDGAVKQQNLKQTSKETCRKTNRTLKQNLKRIRRDTTIKSYLQADILSRIRRFLIVVEWEWLERSKQYYAKSSFVALA